MSSIAASGDTARRANVSGRSAPLKSRVVSALLLGPLALAALYVGYPVFDLVVAAAVAIMAWEWYRLCAEGRFDISGYVFAATVLTVAGLAAVRLYAEALILLPAGAVAVAALVAVRSGRAPLWAAAGVLAIGVTGVALLSLRAGQNGLSVTLWLLITVWATDIAAFFAGRAIGGPRLAPTISPNKTWAGLAGGMAAAAIWGVVWALWTDAGQAGTLALVGAGTAVLAQLGDLAVSVVKRRFGAKDASSLIPGHGGLLDRVDGVMGAAPFVALSVALAKGDMSLWA